MLRERSKSVMRWGCGKRPMSVSDILAAHLPFPQFVKIVRRRESLNTSSTTTQQTWRPLLYSTS